MTHSRTRRLTTTALVVGIAALGVAACGSSSGTGAQSSSSSSASAAGSAAGGTGGNRAKLVACLKSHGVTLPSRPAGAGRGGGAGAPGAGASSRPGGGAFFGGGGGAGRFANNPKLRAAVQACGGGLGGRRRGLNHAAVTKFVACVKQHGYDLPAPNFSGRGSIFPAAIEKNAKFRAASQACASTLRPSGSGAGAGGTGSGSSTGGA